MRKPKMMQTEVNNNANITPPVILSENILPDSPDSALPQTSVADDADGISEHRLAPYIAHT